jgi:hypothetical protein
MLRGNPQREGFRRQNQAGDSQIHSFTVKGGGWGKRIFIKKVEIAFFFNMIDELVG